MSASLGKRILKWTLIITPWILTLLLAAGWGLTMWAPGYLEKQVPIIAADMGIELTRFQIRNAGLFSADIGPVQVGKGDRAVRLANVHVTYTPASLKMGQVNSVELEGVTLECSYDGEKFVLPALELLPASDDTKPSDNTIPSLPFDELILTNSTLNCELKGDRLSIPFAALITPGKDLGFEVAITPRDQTINISGTLGPTINDLEIKVNTKGFHLGAVADFMPVAVSGRMDLDLTAKGDITKPEMFDARFDFSMAHGDLSGVGVTLQEDEIIHIKGRLEEQVVFFSMDEVGIVNPVPATVAIRSGLASRQSLSAQFNLTGAGIRMGGRFDADKVDDMWDVSLTAANSKNLTVDVEGRKISLAGVSFSLQGKAGPGKADVVLNCGTRGTALGRTGFKSGGVRLTLPLKWPAPKRHTPGKLTVNNLRLDKRKLGNIYSTIRQQGTNITYSGSLSTNLLPKLRIGLSGMASLVRNDIGLDFAIKKYALPASFDPATIAPDLSGITVAGNLDVAGGVKIDLDGVTTRVKMNFSDGRVTLAEGQTVISGINLGFESPELHPLRSSPAQRLTFDSMSSGAIALTEGEVVYQLEPEGVLLVEQAGFDWAGGHVSSKAFRVKAGAKRYVVTMFCSQLKLSEILGQLGMAKAQGEASLSGELPIAWDRGKISFNNGFLHSTPGESGTIQVEAMADLLASIPEGTPQRGQIELAQAAVKNFEYKWVRIKADTVGENLMVRLSVDGKPVGTLPFVYKKEFGGFAKVTGDVKGSNFQGLRLDVNFSVPLDRILLYKDIVNMIE